MNKREARATLKRAADSVGGMAELARRIGGSVQRQHVHYWMKAGRVPAEHCQAIEEATEGQFTRADIRPDIFKEAP